MRFKSFCQISCLSQSAAVRCDPVGHTVNHSLDFHIESLSIRIIFVAILLGIIRALISAVHKDALGDPQRAGSLSLVVDGYSPDAILQFAGSQCLGLGLISQTCFEGLCIVFSAVLGKIPSRAGNLDHIVLDLVAIIILGQICPFSDPGFCTSLTSDGQSDIVLHDRIIDIRDIAHLVGLGLHLTGFIDHGFAVSTQLIHIIFSQQTEGNRLVLRIVLYLNRITIFVEPHFCRLHRRLNNLMLVGQAGDIGDGAAVFGAFLLINQLVLRQDILHGLVAISILFLEFRFTVFFIIDGKSIFCFSYENARRRNGISTVIGSGNRGFAGSVVQQTFFNPTIFNYLALIVILVDALDHVSPVVRVVQDGIINRGGIFRAIRTKGIGILFLRSNALDGLPIVTDLALQFNDDAVWPDTVTVIPVVPLLGYSNAILANVGVDELDDVCGIAAGGCISTRGVIDRLSEISRNTLAGDVVHRLVWLNIDATVGDRHKCRIVYIVAFFHDQRLHFICGWIIDIVSIGGRINDPITVQIILIGNAGRRVALIPLAINANRNIHFDDVLFAVRRILGGIGIVHLPDAVIMLTLILQVISELTKINGRTIVGFLRNHLPGAGVPIQMLQHETEYLLAVRDSIGTFIVQPVHELFGSQPSFRDLPPVLTVMVVEMPLTLAVHVSIRSADDPARAVLNADIGGIWRKNQTCRI